MTKAKYTPEERKLVKAENIRKMLAKKKAEGYTQKSSERENAILMGNKTYMGKKPCSRCGSYEKYVSSYNCAPCAIKTGLEKLNDPELIAPYRTKEKTSNKTYRYRAAKFSQTLVLTKEENERILTLYKECAILTEATGVLHHVDHIHPISKGGIHHPDNLQILTAMENISKGNKTE